MLLLVSMLIGKHVRISCADWEALAHSCFRHGSRTILGLFVGMEIIIMLEIIILYNELALDHVQLVTLAMIRGEF